MVDRVRGNLSGDKVICRGAGMICARGVCAFAVTGKNVKANKTISDRRKGRVKVAGIWFNATQTVSLRRRNATACSMTGLQKVRDVFTRNQG